MEQTRPRGKQEPTRLHWKDIIKKQHRRTPAFLREAQLHEKIPKAMKHDAYLAKGLGYLVRSQFAWRNFTFHYSGTIQDFTNSQWEVQPSMLLLWRVFMAVYQITWVVMSATVLYEEGPAKAGWLWPILSTNWHEMCIGLYVLLALISFCVARVRAKRVSPEPSEEEQQSEQEMLSNDLLIDMEGKAARTWGRDVVIDMGDEDELQVKTSAWSMHTQSTVSLKKEGSKASQKVAPEPEPTRKSADEKASEQKKSLPWYMKLQWALFYICVLGAYPKIQFLTSGFSETYNIYDAMFSVTFLFVVIELIIVNYPARFLHLWVSELFYFAYVGFTALYWYKGGINRNGKPYILWEYDWERPQFTAINVAVYSCTLLPSIQALMVLIVCVRKRLYLRSMHLQ